MSTRLRAKSLSSTPAPEDLEQFFKSLLTANWREKLILQGYGWHFDTQAAFATAITGGGAGTVVDLDQPEFGISVPTGKCMIPLEINITINPGVNAADNEVTTAYINLDNTAAWAGDGTVVEETCFNLRCDIASTTRPGGLRVFSAATADITAPVASAMLAGKTARANFGDATGMSIEHCDLKFRPDYPIFIIGPKAVYGYFGGTVAATGFAYGDFLAIPDDLVDAIAQV